MGSVEKDAGKIAKRARVQDAVLLTLYGVSGAALLALAPNALRLLKYIDPDFTGKRNPAYRIKEAAARLESRGLLTKSKRGGTFSFTLTPEGKRRAEALEEMRRVKMVRPKRWDGRWRIVIFDVWERRRDVRQRLRALLEKAGFIRLQDSVWVYPYPCEEFIAFVRAHLRLGSGMLYIIAEGIENDRHLRLHFGLPK